MNQWTKVAFAACVGAAVEFYAGDAAAAFIAGDVGLAPAPGSDAALLAQLFRPAGLCLGLLSGAVVGSRRCAVMRRGG